MNSDANHDFFLSEERFDFDVPLSPASSKEDDDEDEVFVGPISHKERCITIGVEGSLGSSGRFLDEEPRWSLGDGFEEISKEAHQLANQLEDSQHHLANQPAAPASDAAAAKSNEELGDAHFVMVSEAKLEVFSTPVDVILSPIKRETFCVQDSPLKVLPPAIQQKLLGTTGASCSRRPPSASRASASSAGTAAPAQGAKPQTQPKMGLRGRAGLTSAPGMLPCKAATPVGTVAPLTRSRPAPADKRFPPPSKTTQGSRPSRLASGPSSRLGSSEEHLSDATSVASDASDSSLNSSLHSRRPLAPPSKAGLRSLSAVKALPQPTRKRNVSSSSSSSVSSINSSLSVSPSGKAKLNSSLNTGGPSRRLSTSVPSAGVSTSGPSTRLSTSVPSTRLSTGGPSTRVSTGGPSTRVSTGGPSARVSTGGPSARVSTSVSRLANSGPTAKNGRPILTRSSSTTAGAQRSTPAQGKRPGEADRSLLGRSTPVKRSEQGGVSAGTPLHHTPAKRAMERTSSMSSIPPSPSVKAEAVVKPTPKLKAFIAPTPTSRFGGQRKPEAVSPPEAPRIMKPSRLVSTRSVDSLPQSATPAPGLQTPSAGGQGTLQSRMRRPSALPTPVNRRLSSIPTPRSLARPTPSQAPLPASAARRDSHWSPVQMKVTQHQEGPLLEASAPGEEAELQPISLVFSLEDEPEQQPPAPAAPQPDSQETQPSSRVCPAAQDHPKCGAGQPEDPYATQENQENQAPESKEESEKLQEPETTGIKMLEPNQVLLVDIPAPVLRPVEKLLIDLSNTPVLLRSTSTKPSGGQLIDLTSPLIKWSPEDKKENVVEDAPLINLSF